MAHPAAFSIFRSLALIPYNKDFWDLETVDSTITTAPETLANASRRARVLECARRINHVTGYLPRITAATLPHTKCAFIVSRQ